MTIEKAIEILTYHFKGYTVKRDPDFFNACYLGIEALKEVKRQRRLPYSVTWEMLPGETKET